MTQAELKSGRGRRRQVISPVTAWIVFRAFCAGTGWILSALHQLNRAGYVVAFLLGIVALIVWQRKTRARWLLLPRWPRRRFRRSFPRAFVILSAMVILGGALYAPTNYDAMAYRVTRVLHWLGEERWHWIHTFFPRVNTRGTGIEWVSAPFIALLKTDRLLFLINIISFLLLPGLVFSLFTRLGVRRRVAWHWMWIMPAGYCFLLQAGSIGNDLFGAVFVLAAMDFALRSNVTKDPRDFWMSILAAAIFTNAKLSNLPLVLPVAVALLPSLPLLWRWPLRTAVVCVLAVLVSVVPISVLNVRYCGDWSGLKTEGMGMKKNLLAQTGATATLSVFGNFVPPVFPMLGRWNQMVERAIPEKLHAQLDQTMEAPGNKLSLLGEMQVEENAGLGFGVSVLLLTSIFAVAFGRGREPTTPVQRRSIHQFCTRCAVVIPLLTLITQSNLAGPARILTPYYGLLLPIFLVAAGHDRLVTRRWWRALAHMGFVMAAGLLIISPSRPLFPVRAVLKVLENHAGGSKWFTRMQTVYSVYRERRDAFAPVRAALPPDLKVLGMITYDDPEASLWRPYGSRRVGHVRQEDTAEDLKRRGISYVLFRPDVFEQWFKESEGDWLKRMNARPVQTVRLRLRAASAAMDWELVQLQ